ncbi:hypothetical protein [Jannaschia aquimarina]|uniref:Uncharacterized protein n=1 Tax=Jannaschia aquimarina TaxID=935700 RepID=A0A0D1DCK0_9RHOB|nr:hypothetical protein [Jannaschia aquimarina]KIT17708.1 hypothetical protein jaqu_05990 [Jannaschia aquimarina]SNS78511.1 hypothetical protein SAMN05421775_102282 [Jannaschia aquimarina]
MRRLTLALSLVIAGGPAFAERTVSGAEFERMVTGKTFYFDRFGRPFGAEQYFEDKRVIWAFEGGQCQRGIWFENRSGQICFVYDGDPAPQCWDFIEMPSGDFHARADGADPSEDLVTSNVDTGDLDCPLPDLGV